MQRIRWSNVENELISSSLARVFADEPTASNEAALRKAQMQLPAFRRAKISYTKLKTYGPMIDVARERALQARQTRNAPLQQQPTPTPAIEPTLSLETAIGKALVVLVDQICVMVIERMQSAAAKTTTPVAAPVAQVDRGEARANVREREILAGTTAAEDAEVRRVLIIGLMGAQVDTIRDKYRDRPVSLAFMTADEAKSQPLLWRHPIILMTKFISHAVQTKAQQASSKVRYCNGGVTECCEILDQITKGAK